MRNLGYYNKSLETGSVVQLVRAPPCHGGSCGFEPRQTRKFIPVSEIPTDFHYKLSVGEIGAYIAFLTISPTSVRTIDINSFWLTRRDN
jgi:hypothetical protein